MLILLTGFSRGFVEAPPIFPGIRHVADSKIEYLRYNAPITQEE